ncbi:uncharacterized protein (DUF885 family) [Breznakia sp. PF5-3]|uniref:DUF885 domain-containing protein n=1 Tax=unclassified Breznakia TaxID=2623764 RepID=UPI0024061839|nr:MULTISPECIES: DUF885 domain-containing protein [unclassified Breznakia]MDF9824631.1 uncharacterized protein (DUF885 family) [Breznakia sp. PM6-1]MDF9835567.1 uncharacterized protein (DUF885 family) [Breznakia sp. PF5-3]
MKKIAKLLFVVLLAVTLVACGDDGGVASEPNKDFDKFVDELPGKMFEETDYELNFFFEDKEAVGYKDVTYEFSLPSKKKYDKDLKDTKEFYEKVKDFKRSSLSEDQQLTYDVLLDAFDTESDVSDKANYYLSTNYLDSVYGEPGNLPLNLYFYKFRTKNDIDSYINLLKTSPEYFVGLAKHEQERQDKGYGMTPSQIEAVIKQCDDFIKADHAFLIESFNEKINSFEGLEDAKKKEYIETNKKYVKEGIVKAYSDLKTELEKLDVKTKKDEGYASVYKDGKEYYEELIYANTGFDDVEDYREYLEDKSKELLKKAREAVNASEEVYNKVFAESAENGVIYTKATSPQETIEQLENDIKEDFPEIRKVEYQMEIVPKSMQSIFSAAAAYFTSPVDSLDAKEMMVLNGEYKQDEFLTIAHEGFPGHMYQIQYYKEFGDAPMIRQLLGYSGYTEGYANYVEQYSAKYAIDAEAAEAYTYLQQYSYAEILLLDIRIHYDGISEEKAKKEFNKLYSGQLSEEDLKSAYEQLLHTPGIFSKYYGAGFRLTDLRESIKSEMGDDYTDKKYHKALLDVGPASYKIVEEYIQNQLLD